MRATRLMATPGVSGLLMLVVTMVIVLALDPPAGAFLAGGGLARVQDPLLLAIGAAVGAVVRQWWHLPCLAVIISAIWTFYLRSTRFETDHYWLFSAAAGAIALLLIASLAAIVARLVASGSRGEVRPK